MKWFISDHHFNNFNINLYSNRPFLHHVVDNKIYLNNKIIEETDIHTKYDTRTLSTSELIKVWRDELQNKNPIFLKARNLTVSYMNQECIKRWNKKIKKDDIVFYIGDFAFPCRIDQMKKITFQLNGKLNLISGNHDKGNAFMKEGGFAEVHKELEIKIGDYDILLCHYPYLNPIFNKLAEKRPNMIKKYKKSLPSHKEEMRKIINELKQTTELTKVNTLLRNACSLNLHIDNEDEKKLYNRLKQFISRYIGTKPINKGKVLAHGHTHNENVRFLNMFNFCVEAHNYYPVSEDEFLQYIRAYEAEINRLKTNDLNFIENNLALYENYSEINNEINQVLSAYNMVKRNVVYFPQNYTPLFYQILKENKMLIPKNELIDQTFYEGRCRNASLAIWDAKKEQFFYLRSKFGNEFIEPICHPEDDDGYDLFVPKKEAPFNQKVYDAYLEYLTPRSNS